MFWGENCIANSILNAHFLIKYCINPWIILRKHYEFYVRNMTFINGEVNWDQINYIE